MEMPGAGAPPAGAVPPMPMPPGQPGPTSPATVAPDSAGMRARGLVQADLAIKTLMKAAQMLGPTTEEGHEILVALAKLSKTFGQSSPELQRQEVKMLGEQAPAQQGPGPGLAQAIQQRLGGMGMGRPAA